MEMSIAELHATHSDVAMTEARSIRARPTPLQSQAKAIAVAEDTSQSRPQHERFSAQLQRNPCCLQAAVSKEMDQQVSAQHRGPFPFNLRDV